jgi:hypothetical protein
MEQEQSTNQTSQIPCNCPACGGQCPRCRMEGCGMCPYCQKTRCPVCPMCVRQQEPFVGQETLQKTVNKLNLTFDRVVLLLILLLVGYIAYRHYGSS